MIKNRETKTKLRIREAIEYYRKKHGRKKTQVEVAEKMNPGMSEEGAYIRLSKLKSGKLTLINLDEVATLCKEYEVDPNFLFGYGE